MKNNILKSLIVLLTFHTVGCSSNQIVLPDQNQDNLSQITLSSVSDYGQNLSWGFYDLIIARDGSTVEITPNRSVNTTWGYHLNAVKLLEVDPCTDCLSIGNIHLLPSGDLSLDVSITHPFTNPVYTGFDVRGIIMFPASQIWPDNDLRSQAGLEPYEPWLLKWSSHDKGDAELVNLDGWTLIWAPDHIIDGLSYGDFYRFYELGILEDLPIFNYYPGKYASGENLGTINAFKRFFTNENRHIFGAGQTATRTYIIRPPATGPIKASYAIYAHWAPPDVTPVNNPVVDFPPEANSPMPYEFEVYQDTVIDPDWPFEQYLEHVHWLIKTWDIGVEFWIGSSADLLMAGGPGGTLHPHPSGNPDEYSIPVYALDYDLVPGALPGTWPFLCRVEVRDPANPTWPIPLGTDWYIAEFDIEASDGTW